MYHLEEKQLRVCAEYLNSTELSAQLANCRLILLQHILPDTEEFIMLIHKQNIEIFSVIAKPYSIDEDSIKKISDLGIRVVREPYTILDETNFLDKLLEEATLLSEKDGKSILILEVGGYFARVLSQSNTKTNKYLKGVVEVTTFGHNRYREMINDINVPVYSVARSPIKNIEAKFVGISAIVSVDKILRGFGTSMAGRSALVIGFGMIGKSIAQALHAQNICVSIYDLRAIERLNAFTQGYKIGCKSDLLSNADIIFSSTAGRGITLEDMLLCKSGAILASVGSKKNEIEVEALSNIALNSKILDPYVTQYNMPNFKHIFLLKEGTAINFLVNSCPNEVVDLIFAEILSCVKLILNDAESKPLHQLLETPQAEIDLTASTWLSHVTS
jgi:adenosylhomocysteinase